jgi:hypothetical protein
MEQLSTNHPVIWEEICMIQQGILAAASQCQPGGAQMCTVVGGNTPMTFVAGVMSVDVTSGAVTPAPTYQLVSATAGQTVINTTVTTIAASAGVSYLLVFNNGVLQLENTAYSVSGTNQLIFTYSLAAADEIAIYSYAGGIGAGGGAGYVTDTPAVYFNPPVGVTPLVVATGVVATNGGNVLAINVTNGGLGYQPVSATMSVSSVAGVGAVIEPLVNGAGAIVALNIANAGSGYTVNDTVLASRAVLSNPAYIDASFVITAVGITGEIISVAILQPGSGYQASVTEAVIVSSLNSTLPYPTGTGFYGTVLTDAAGTISQVVVDTTGAGYAEYPPYMVITDVGTGAETTVVLNGATVSEVIVDSPGTGYTTNAIGTIFNPPTAPLPNPPVVPASVTINVSENKFGTTPNLYYQVFAGTATNTPIQLQMNSVISYFKKLGYSIIVQTNPDTGSTIQWKICW